MDYIQSFISNVQFSAFTFISLELNQCPNVTVLREQALMEKHADYAFNIACGISNRQRSVG